jgi:uncharacterized RDD family membrane protein YckC
MTDSQLQQKRLAAAAIDIAILFVLGIIMSIAVFAMSCAGTHVDFLGTWGTTLVVILGAGVSLVYVLARDVVAGDRSLGKKLMNIRVVRVTGEPISIMESVKRNVLFSPGLIIGVLLSILGLIPIAGGCIACVLWPLRALAGLFALGAGIWEIIQIFQQPEGIRAGDKMAGTRVTF